MELKNLLGYKEFVEKDIRKFDIKESPNSISSKDVLSADQPVVTKDNTEDFDETDLKNVFKSKETDLTVTGKDATALTETKSVDEKCEGCEGCEKCKELGEKCEDCKKKKSCDESEEKI